jgi:hypothetical protein
MSIEHFTAAFNCKNFKNGARLLLLSLANRASDGKPRKDGKKPMEYGWSFAGIGRLMADMNASSRDTVIDNMKVLVKAGVVKRERRLSHSSLSFVDIDVLRSLAYTEEDVEEFKRKADTKVGKSTTTGHEAGEKALPLKNGESATTYVGEIPLSNVGELPPTDVCEIPTAAVGKFPTHNQKLNPKYEPQGNEASDGEPSESESELADADSDCRYGKSNTGKYPYLPTGFGEQVVIGESSDSDLEDHLVDPEDEIVVSGKGKATPACLQDNPDPDPKEYEDVVHLCSIWWATHSNRMDEIETTPVRNPHPWGHPRTWTPEQRREAFLKGQWGQDPNSLQLVLAPDPELEHEDEAGAPDLAKVEEALLRDEGKMLEIYLKHGREVVEEVIVWLPKSDFWFGRITSLAKLKTDFDRVYGSYEKYLLKTKESGSDVECDDYVHGIFLETGGAAAESICYERLNPCNPADAAEEEAMDAYDDEHDEGFFDVWAELDYEADQQAEESGDGMFDPWAELDDRDDTLEESFVPDGELGACRTPPELHSSSTNEGTLAKLFSAYYYGNKQVMNDERQLQEGLWAGVFRDMYCGQGAANTVPAFEQFLNLVKADTELSRIVLSLKPNFSLSSLLANKSRIEREKGVAISDCFEDE